MSLLEAYVVETFMSSKSFIKWEAFDGGTWSTRSSYVEYIAKISAIVNMRICGSLVNTTPSITRRIQQKAPC